MFILFARNTSYIHISTTRNNMSCGDIPQLLQIMFHSIYIVPALSHHFLFQVMLDTYANLAYVLYQIYLPMSHMMLII